MGFAVASHRDWALAERLERSEFPRGARELDHRVQIDPEGHFVARDGEGRPVGACACVVYPGAELAWIGGMVVLPAARRRGVARALLRACLDHAEAKRCRTVGLDASDAGRPLYESEGFRPVGPTSRWTARGPAPSVASARFSLFPASATELGEIAAFDRPRFGANRAPWLGAVLRDRPAEAFVAYERPSGALAGYVLGQERFIGPLVADDPEAAALLLRAVDGLHPARVLHLLEYVPDALAVARSAGYAYDGARMVRMVRGGPLPGRPGTQYATGAWALG